MQRHCSSLDAMDEVEEGTSSGTVALACSPPTATNQDSGKDKNGLVDLVCLSVYLFMKYKMLRCFLSLSMQTGLA